MKKKLSMKQTIVVASMLFGMFFGAGNLIFPVHLGQLAGNNMWMAMIGFIITAVTIPILAVAANATTHSDNLLKLSQKVSNWYGYVFTTALYLTIGPFFAIPRCATVSFTTGVAPLIGDFSVTWATLIFSAVFFALVLFFSLKPNGIMTSIGKVINPIFLVFLAILIVVALIHPGASVSAVAPTADGYVNGTKSFFNGFIEGYGTMDAIAGLAFGVVVINVIRSLGVEDDGQVAKETVKSGVFTAILMALIYFLTILIGAQSLGYTSLSENGGIAFAEIAEHYLGKFGTIILAITITAACLKTSIGLVISCSEIFVKMFPKVLNYKLWAIIFTVFSFVVSNVGLTAIINYSLPVLMLLYPLAITLIVLALFDKTFGGSKCVYVCVTVGAFIAAVFDFLKTLPDAVQTALHIPAATAFAEKVLPLFKLGLGWIVPSVIGLAVGLLLKFTVFRKK